MEEKLIELINELEYETEIVGIPENSDFVDPTSYRVGVVYAYNSILAELRGILENITE